MKYPAEYLEEIKSRLKVSTVVSRSVNLKKRGKEFIGISPFTNEKTPSFTVNDQKGFYHCFSSNEHGNIFDFLMKAANMKFGEAVKTKIKTLLVIYCKRGSFFVSKWRNPNKFFASFF